MLDTILHFTLYTLHSPSLAFYPFSEEDLADNDRDGDGLPLIDELFVYHTDPRNADTDYDGLTDYEELFVYNTDPLDPKVDAYREATENYRRFMDAMDEYVERMSEDTSERIGKEAEKCRNRAKTLRSAPPPLRGFLSNVQVCKCASSQRSAPASSTSGLKIGAGAGLLTDDRLHTCTFAH